MNYNRMKMIPIAWWLVSDQLLSGLTDDDGVTKLILRWQGQDFDE